jgi:hypothetical protein
MAFNEGCLRDVLNAEKLPPVWLEVVQHVVPKIEVRGCGRLSVFLGKARLPSVARMTETWPDGGRVAIVMASS